MAEVAARATDVLGLVTRRSGWGRVRLYGASVTADRVRRRVDSITLALFVLALVVVVPAARTTDGVEAALAEVVASLPTVVAPLAALPYDLLAVWALAMVVVAAIRWQWRLAVSLVTAIPVAVGVTLFLNDALGLEGDAADLALGAPQDGVPVQLVVSLAVASVAARELSRPFRTTTHRLAVAALLGALFLPVASPYRVLCGVLAAGVTAGVVRLAFGTPRTTVSLADVRLGLGDLGIETAPESQWPEGAREAIGVDGSRLGLRTMGRDERDTQLVASVWRFLWYRNSGTFLSPRLQLEHQALLLLLAQQHRVCVTPVVAVGMSRVGDAILATGLDGAELSSFEAGEIDDPLLDKMWRELGALHAAGIAHGALDPRAIRIDGAGAVQMASFVRAEKVTRIGQVHADRAQLLVTTALSVGPERAIGAALRAVAQEPNAATPLIAHLQPAAFDDQLRRSIANAGLSLDDLRAATAAAADIEVPDLQKVYRVSWGSLVRLVLLVAVAYALISQLADIGWDTITEALRSASLPILLAALVLGQTPRVAAAGSLQTASPADVPLLRVTKLMFAICFINIAVPSTAARAATSIRFFQRSGATPAGAVSAGALDSVFGFLAQITLLLTFLVLGLGTLGFGGESSLDVDEATVQKVVAILVGLVIVAVIAYFAVGRLRSLVSKTAGQLKEALSVLRSPDAVVRLLGYNLVAELLFSLTIWTVLRAFGQEVDYVDAIIINEAVALFAGLIPVPGGVGVTEAALTAGFIAVGVPDDIAFSAALCYRLCTFYLPPIWGYLAMNSLQKDGYL